MGRVDIKDSTIRILLGVYYLVRDDKYIRNKEYKELKYIKNVK